MRNKICLITGGSGFLGIEFCNFFSSIDFQVVCVDIKKPNFKKLKKNISFYQCDISNEQEEIKLYNKFKKKNIQVLINNAAIDAVPKIKKKTNMKYPSIDVWWKEINVGLIGSFLMIKYFGEQMFKNKKGSVINIGSDLSIIAPNQKIYKSSYVNYKKPPTYSVIKHGLLGLTKYYASLYAEKNVRVNMVSPGPVKNKQNNLLLKEIKKITPMNRLNDPKDLFGILEFLSGNYSQFITGQNIVIDGGKTLI